MAPQTPVPSFHYDSEPLKGSWSQKYSKSAFPSGSDVTVKRLYKRASELVSTHKIILKAFAAHATPRIDLDRKRDEVAAILQAEFEDDIAINGHDAFALRLCKGVLTYQGGSGATTEIKREMSESVSSSDGDAQQQESSQKINNIKPAYDTSLQDFEINCFPHRFGVDNIACKMRTRQLTELSLDAPLELTAVRFKILWSRLEARNLLNNSGFQCLTYDTPEGKIGIQDDEDLQNAIHYHRGRDQKILTINVTTQDDIG